MTFLMSILFIIFSTFAIADVDGFSSTGSTETMLETVGGEVEDVPGGLAKGLQKTKDKTTDFIDSSVDDITRDLGMSLFEELTNFELFNKSFGDLNVKLQVQRRLYPNFDIFDSYTVVDTFRIPFSLPIINSSKALEFIPGLQAGFSLGASGSFQVQDIRQVVPKFITSYPSWGDFSLKKNFFENINLENIKEFFSGSINYTEKEKESLYEYLSGARNAIKEDEVIELHKDKGFVKKILQDQSNVARYGKILNVFTSPLKIPLKAKSVKKLHVGEIVSYTSSGYLQLAGNIGWNYDITGITSPLKSQVSLSTYVNGTYRVSIMRDGKDSAKVKVSRIKSMGINKSLYPISLQHTLLDSFAVLGFDVDLDLSFIPFKFNSGKSKGTSFDVIYKYDLTQEKGRKAYQKAVKGFLAYSEKIHLSELKTDTPNPAVRKVVKKETNFTNKSRSNAWELNFIFKRTRSNNLTYSRSKIHIPSGPDKGTHYVKSGVVHRAKQWSNIFGFKEKKSQIFTVQMDEEKINNNDPTGFSLMAQFTTEDNKTTGRELNKYLKKYHTALGWDGVNQRIMPHVPKRLPKKEDIDDDGEVEYSWKKAWYGKTSIYLKMQYDWPQIQKFINKDPVEFAKILTDLFNINIKVNDDIFKELNAKASRVKNSRKKRKIIKLKGILKDWLKLRNYKNLTHLHKKLSRFFKEHKKGFKLARVIRLALAGERVAYTYTLNNEDLGTFSNTQSNFTTVEDITAKANSSLSFDRIGNRPPENTKDSVQEVKLEKQDDGRIKVLIKLAHVPEFIYLRFKDFTFNSTHAEIRKVISNKERFKVGENVFYISKKDNKFKFLSQWSKLIKNHRKFILSAGVSIDGHSWSGVKNGSIIPRNWPKEDVQK